MPALNAPDSVSKTNVTVSNSLRTELGASNYDVVAFLNDHLPSLSLSSQTSSAATNRTSQIQSSSSQVQSLLGSLNSHYAHSSTELTNLTDEILRSGNRLAYEVEVLRGDANGLYDVLTDGLKEDVQLFVREETLLTTLNGGDEQSSSDAAVTASTDPVFISQLRLLGLVKGRLESVIHIFGEAMKWPAPAPEASMSSNFISVSAPELGMVESPEDLKAREFSLALRASITDLMDSRGGGYIGLDMAARKVDDLRSLSLLWKGTSEEKARTRVIDGLAEILEERRALLDSRNPSMSGQKGSGTQDQDGTSSVRQGRFAPGGAASGLLRNLQKLRGEVYLE